MKRALIIGPTGQDGMYLTRLLLSKGYRVYGVVRGQNNPKTEALRKWAPEINIITGDLLDPTSLISALRTSEADEVYNLGAISSVPYSWQNPQLTSQVTGIGVLNILEAIRAHHRENLQRVKFYQASSSEIFGNVQEVPQKETTLLWPRSPYGAAKAFGHHLTVNYRESYGMHASSGILFNHESPLRGSEFVTRKISIGVARIALGLQETISLGNLDSRRDWGFAGDYVEAMWAMLQQEVASDYVIATGEAHSVREFLTAAFNYVGIPRWERHVVQEGQYFRPAEVDLLVGDATKANTLLGWRPTLGFDDLVSMMVESDLLAQTKKRDILPDSARTES